MERIRCPHCNAVNQDAEPTDNCWQCGKPLSAAAPAAKPPVPAAIPAEPPPSAPMIEVQQPGVPARGQSVPTLEERVAARKAARKGVNRAVPAIVIAVLLIIALIIFLSLRH